MLPEGGCLDGFLSPRFIVIFLACLFTLLSKIDFFSGFYFTSTSEPVLTLSLNFATLFLPGLITGITCTWHPTIFRTFEDFTRPSLFLLPAFSFFTFKSNSPKCCSGRHFEANEVHIRFSRKGTIFNILFSLGGLLVSGLYYIIAEFSFSSFPTFVKVSPFIIARSLPGVLLTLLFICTSSSSSLEIGVYKPFASNKVFVLDQENMEVKEVEEGEDVEGEQLQLQAMEE